jgi:predicted metal-dependent hydrolase
LQRSARKSLSLQIKRDGSLVVKAPLKLAITKIEGFILSKQVWIQKRKEIQKTKICLNFEENSKYYWYQGNKYPLKILADQKKFVGLKGGIFYLINKNINFTNLDRNLYIWEKQQTQNRIQDLLAVALCKFEELSKFHLIFKYKRMKTRWGSCSNKGVLTFNTKLLQIQPEALEGVFWHEISHLFELNHGPKFYERLKFFYPDFKNSEKKLKSWHL